ncbi:unnamed protein product [Nezara viridula]|uniref:Uncharacterized protein n=1 Tax=Nezara viridula TaxID=85310 RepID=A0A9P0HJE3_NEZVI|nr:unnamed protein product [Nezara viridula]
MTSKDNNGGHFLIIITKGDLNKRADKGQTIVYNNGLFRRSTSYFLTLSPSAGPMHFLHVPWRRKT